MKVLGLDIATRTGWCLYDTEADTYEVGVINLTPGRNEPEGKRFWRMANQVPDVLRGVGAVVIERTMTRAKRAAEVLSGLTAVVLVELEERDIEYAFVHALTLKKFATGRGSATKEEMINAVNLEGRLDKVLVDDNEADAYWLVRYWQEEMR